MANTKIQREALAWVAEFGLQSHFPGVEFKPGVVQLCWGGSARVSAVNEAQSICGYVTTSAARTVSGDLGTAKIFRLRAEALFLTNLLRPHTTFIATTDRSMHEHMLGEQEKGRFPKDVEIIYSQLPETILKKLLAAQEDASLETSPRRTTLAGDQ